MVCLFYVLEKNIISRFFHVETNAQDGFAKLQNKMYHVSQQ